MLSYLAEFFYSLNNLAYFHFLRPQWLLLAIPMALILRTFTQRDDSLAMWRNMMSPQIIKHLTVKGNSSHWFTPRNITWLNTLLAIIVLAGPTWQQQPSPFTEDKSALIIALDVSKTMEQSDIQPSRLLRAKQKIIELLALRGDANTALIAFSGSAHVVMPITNDSEMIRHFLDALEAKLMPNSGKLPQKVLPLAEQLLAPTKTVGTILLVGDGASSDSIDKFSTYFKQQSHQLIVWAIGDKNNVANSEQDSSIIPMQLPLLAQLAEKSNGQLVVMSHNKQDIEKVNSYINNTLSIVDDESRPWHDSGYPLVFVIAILFLLWFRKGWTIQW
ncbi:MAG: VWA domain-containing protein [Colwellia sp.]